MVPYLVLFWSQNLRWMEMMRIFILTIEVPQINIVDFSQSNIAIAISTISSLLLLHSALCNVSSKSVLLLVCHWMDIAIKVC